MDRGEALAVVGRAADADDAPAAPRCLLVCGLLHLAPRNGVRFRHRKIGKVREEEHRQLVGRLDEETLRVRKRPSLTRVEDADDGVRTLPHVESGAPWAARALAALEFESARRRVTRRQIRIDHIPRLDLDDVSTPRARPIQMDHAKCSRRR